MQSSMPFARRECVRALRIHPVLRKPPSLPTRRASGPRGVQAAETAGRLLLALGERSSAVSLKDLAAAAGLTASTAHPYLVSLARLGLIAQDPESGRYELGPATLRLGLSSLRRLDAVREATPEAIALASRIGHTVILAVWGNFGPTVVRLIESDAPIHVNMRTGTVMSVTGTATGHAFAGWLPPAVLMQAAAGAVGARDTDAAPGSTALRRRLAEIGRRVRETGIGQAIGHPIPGINAVSAPVFDAQGRMVLALTALGPAASFPPEPEGALAREVVAVARAVSRRLGAA